MVIYTLLLLVALQGSDSATLSLRASKSNPYQGEVIEITLTLQGRAWKMVNSPTLTLPAWINQIVKSASLEAWSKPDGGSGLRLQCEGKVIYARPTAKDTWQLSWKHLVVQPDEQEGSVLKLEGVKVDKLISQPLTLELQTPPPLPASPTIWDLGVGNFGVQAQWLTDKVVLGEEVTLEFTVTGAGNLAAIPVPVLRQFPGWEGDRALIDVGKPAFKGQHFQVRFLVRPRQLQVRFAPLTIRYFDPDREAVVTQQVSIPALAIYAFHGQATTGSAIEDARRQLTSSQWTLLTEHMEESRWPARLLAWGRWLPLLVVVVLLLRLLADRWLPGWIVRLRWRKALHLAQIDWQQDHSTPRRLRHLLAQVCSVRYAERVSAESEALQQLTENSVLHPLLKPLLIECERWEYGPDTTRNQANVYELANAFFAEARRL